MAFRQRLLQGEKRTALIPREPSVHNNPHDGAQMLFLVYLAGLPLSMQRATMTSRPQTYIPSTAT